MKLNDEAFNEWLTKNFPTATDLEKMNMRLAYSQGMLDATTKALEELQALLAPGKPK